MQEGLVKMKKLTKKETKANYKRLQDAKAVYLTAAGWEEVEANRVQKPLGVELIEPMWSYNADGNFFLLTLSQAVAKQESIDLDLLAVVEKVEAKKTATKKKLSPLPQIRHGWGKCGIG
jgi:hypothetical protein